MVIRQNGQPRSPFESVFNDPSSYRFGHPAKLGISATLDVTRTLQLQRNIVRPALLAFDKTIIESGHESSGIYTKKLHTAGNAETAERGEGTIFSTAPALLAFLAESDFRGCFSRPSVASKYARLKGIRRGSSRPLKDFIV